MPALHLPRGSLHVGWGCGQNAKIPMGYCACEPLGVFYGSNAKSSWKSLLGKFLLEACRKVNLESTSEVLPCMT
jgi:hypothetical protein